MDPSGGIFQHYQITPFILLTAFIRKIFRQMRCSVPATFLFRFAAARRYASVPRLWHSAAILRMSSSSQASSGGDDGDTASSSSSSNEAPLPIPRAAVSTLVRYNAAITINSADDDDEDDGSSRYLLIQRGKPPNEGMWSLPGGKLEYGETTLHGAMRELREETVWPGDDVLDDVLRWHERPICTSDVIGEGYHYVIAQCFAEVVRNDDDDSESKSNQMSLPPPPRVASADDADDAAFFTRAEITAMCERGECSPGVADVVTRAEDLSAVGLLPTTLTTDRIRE